MELLINEKLRAIEIENEIKILYACESGSRAWGFAHSQSDYDVRFVFVRSIDCYLSLNQKPDTLNFAISDGLDMAGWDIKKFLTLFYKSNAAVLEWLQSPVIYKCEKEWYSEMIRLIPEFYNPLAVYHHYMGMTKSALYALEKETNSKKYLSLIRSVLVSLWIMKHDTPPPVLFEKVLSGIDLEGNTLEAIRNLIAHRKTGKENLNTDFLITELIENSIAECEKTKSSLKSNYGDIKLLDKLFLTLVKV